MAGLTAIADASASLVAYLEEALVGTLPSRAIVLGEPDDTPTKEPVVSIELVDILENPHLRNGEWIDGQPDPVVHPNTLALDLRYRITVHPAHGGGNDPSERTHRRLEVVGYVMHALHGSAQIDDPYLQGSLADEPPIQVTYDQTDRTPDHAGLAMETPALHYLVTPVVIDPEHDRSGDPRFGDGIRDRLPRLPVLEGRLPTIRLPQNIRMPGADTDQPTRSTTKPNRDRNRDR